MEHTAATLNEICAAIFVDVAAGYNYDKQFKGLFAWSFSVFFIAFHGAFLVSMLVELFVIFSTALSLCGRALKLSCSTCCCRGRAYKAYVIINSMQ